MLKVLCRYEDYNGLEKVVFEDKANEDVYRLNLTSLDTHKLHYDTAVADIAYDINYEKDFEMEKMFKENLIVYIQDSVVEYESCYELEDFMDRQILEWLDSDPFFDGGFDKDKFFKWVKYELNEWSKEEYEHGLDFSDLEKIPLAYTTAGDNEEFEIQVYLDLVSFRWWSEIDGTLFDEEKFDSLNEFWNEFLRNMSFDGLVGSAIFECEEMRG